MLALYAVLEATPSANVAGRAAAADRRLMACRARPAAGMIPGGMVRGWVLAVAGWARRLVTFGPVRRPLPPGPSPGHPESLASGLPPGEEELLAASGDEDFLEW